MVTLNQNLKPLDMKDFRALITEHPDFPKPGILFRDISPILADPAAFGELISLLAQEVRASGANKVLGLEARGFILGVALAYELGIPFVPVRKAGKLPGPTMRESYQLEYGDATFEIQRDKIGPNDKVAIVDDLLATGGTAAAASALVTRGGGKLAGFFFAIELEALKGREKLENSPAFSLLKY